MTFMGALVFTGGPGVVHVNEDYRSGLLWIVAASILYLAVVVVTVRINVPLNDAIKAAGAP